MIFNDSINISGQVNIVVTDKDGKVKQIVDVPNLVVTTGRNHIAARVSGTFTGEGAPISHIGFGTSTITPVLSDTNIFSILGTRMPATITYTAGSNTITTSASFTGTAGNITEAGMFNALTGGTLICRTTFGAVPVLSTDGLAIIWTIKIN
jgi:hypothetical protein